MDLQPGQMLGPYRIVRQIGLGGMATVYQAYQPAMDRDVAIKVLPRDSTKSPEFIGRFHQEARTIAKLEHPHILPVHDFGESDGVPYFVMRYLEGGTLLDRLLAGPLSLAEVDRLFSQLADALGYAHSRGVIHRDVKPSNALIDTRGDLFLTDFGVAKLLAGTSNFTGTGTLGPGTPTYMSPEQAQGEILDQRSDIYSLGIVLYEMLLGRVPYEAETPLAVLLKHLHEPLPLPSTRMPDIAPAIERVLLKALAKEREDRFDSCTAFLVAWKGALAETDLAKHPQPLGSTHTEDKPLPPTLRAEPGPVPTAPPEPKPAPAPRKLPFFLVAGTGAAVLLLLLTTLLIGNGLRRQALSGGTSESTVPPETGSEPGSPGSTSWVAGNKVYAALPVEEGLLAWGPGGITLWNLADGSVERRVTTADGLPHPNVRVILVDEEDQVVWVGTEGGLVRVNREDESQILYNRADGLDSDTVTALTWFEDSLLVGTAYSGKEGGGLQTFEGSRWEAFPDFPSALDADSEDRLSHDITALLIDSGGGLWVGTSHGLGYFDGEEWAVLGQEQGLPGTYVNSLMLDAEGSPWVATDLGVAWFNGEEFETLPKLENIPIFGMVQDEDGHYWFSGAGGLWRFEPEAANWEEFSQGSGDLPSYLMFGATQVEGEGLFFGSEAGLVRYDGTFSTWRIPNLPSQAVFERILPLPDGDLLFIGEYGSGLDRINPEQQAWRGSPKFPCSCLPLRYDAEGNLWASEYDAGVWQIGEGEPRHITEEQGLPKESQIWSVAFAKDGSIWLGGNEGLARLEGDEITLLLNAESGGFSSDDIHALLAASDGSLWVGTHNAVSHLAPDGTWTHYQAGDSFPDNLDDVSDLEEDGEGTIWLSARGTGVYRFREGQWSSVDPGGELPSPVVKSISRAPDGTLWFGTERGAVQWAEEQWKPLEGVALIDKDVRDIYIEPNGVLWFATRGGVTRHAPP